MTRLEGQRTPNPCVAGSNPVTPAKDWKEIAYCNGYIEYRHCIQSSTITMSLISLEPLVVTCACGKELKFEYSTTRSFTIYERG